MGRKRKAVRYNRWPGDCYRCRRRVPELEGQSFEAPLRLVCASCALREGVVGDNGFAGRLAALPIRSGGTDYDLLPFQVEDCKRIATTRAVLIGSQMGTGKCLAPGELVLVNGELSKAQEVWERNVTNLTYGDSSGGHWCDVLADRDLFVNAIDAEGKVVRRRISRLYRQWVKEDLRRVTLRDGSEITITKAHKLRQPGGGWSNEIVQGGRACVPARLLHEEGRFDATVAGLFGWMIGDGHEVQPGQRATAVITQDRAGDRARIASAARSVSELYALGLNVKDTPSGERAGEVRIDSVGFRAFCESRGFPWGTLSADRRVPGPIMRAESGAVRSFLRSYMDADGSVPDYVEYSSASQRLVKEVSTLLRRFGVWVAIRKKRARATNSPDCPMRDYWVGSFGGPSARRYLAEVGFSVDYKQAELEKLCSIKANTNTEGVPASALIAGAVDRSGLPASWFGLSPKHGLSTVYIKGTQEFSRESLGVVVRCMDEILSGQRGEEYLASKARRRKIDAALESLDRDDLRRVRGEASALIEHEVHYPEVEDVEDVAHEGWVYDFEVEGDHNYAAEGVCCHNTVQAAMAALRIDMPNFIFTPASVRENWLKEIGRWRPDLSADACESQAAFRDGFSEVGPGEVMVGSFGVLPGSPCRGCVTLKTRLRELKKWKEPVCFACDQDGQVSIKAAGTCLGCDSPVAMLPKARYLGRWTPTPCEHTGRDFEVEGAEGMVRGKVNHPPYVDLEIDGVDMRLPWHLKKGGAEDWLKFGIRIPKGRRLPPDVTPMGEELCMGCCQSNPLPDVDRPVLLMADECHAFKNPASQRTKNWRGLREAAWAVGSYSFGLSGTPCEGKPMEFWEVLVSFGLERAAFGRWDNYYRIFKGWFEAQKGDRVPPQGELREELHDRLRRVQINRRRKDVLDQLPPRQELVIEVDINESTMSEVNEAVHRMLAVKRAWEDVQSGALSNGLALLDPFRPHLAADERERRRYHYEERVEYYFVERPWNTDVEIVEAVESALLSKGQMPTIDQLSRIRSMLSQAKVAAVQQWILDRESEDEPIVLFSQHVSILKKIAKRPGWACFHGGVSPRKRQAMVEDFQEGRIEKGLAVSLMAGGEGITLTRASVAGFIDLSFNPAKVHQAESRLIRIGAEIHSRILIVRFVAKHIVDRLVMETLREKESLLASLEWSEPECD